ncbi:MAG: hypothetical protein P0Y53_16140 [Candidatus Pseudobacter hemicellulosilyticus]|uniref:DUF4148 domain-containing protein n=1 Tax=Candidatus Pseudobacter hemicellulosilyticus TaxID=3121375 RepID=A0AAJ5WQU0_9BACT|nr:MAG: hypothetical protein P0Y53_16140 [Pseudobacter sp.]
MMNTFSVKMSGLLLAVTLSAAAVQAQEYRTDVSIREQIMNKSVPGAQFAPGATKKLATRKALSGQQEVHNETIGTQLKKGTAPGMTFAPGTGGNARTTRSLAGARNTAAKRSTSALPSDAQAAKPAAPAAERMQLPTQGTSEDKTQTEAPVKKVQTSTVPKPVARPAQQSGGNRTTRQ